jgi:hypothetical protein
MLAEGIRTIDMVKNPLSAIRSLKRTSTLKDITKAGSSAWLEYRFGWAQLKRDVFGFVKALDTARAHVKYLRETAGQERHISASQTDVDTTPYGGYYITNPNGEIQVTRISRTARVHAYHVLSRTYQYATVIDSYLSSVGCDRIAEAVWDAIPWSFVVDWLVNLKKLMGDSSTALSREKLTRVGQSIKTEWFAKLTTSVSYCLKGQSSQTKTHESAEQRIRTFYSRTPGLPTGEEDTGYFGSFSKTNIADGAALILQRL